MFGVMYDFDSGLAFLELLRSFLVFLLALFLASCAVIMAWCMLFRAHVLPVPVTAAKPRRPGRPSETLARRRLFVVTRRA